MLQGLINQRMEDLATLHGAAGIAFNMVSPTEEHGALAEVEEHLHALPACITGMVSLGVWVGATIALAAA